MRVVHQQRLAWDGALTFVRALGSQEVGSWLGEQIGRRFGPAYQQALADSERRLWTSERPDAPQVESGLWRARLGDLLREDPASAPAVGDLIAETAARLERAVDVRVHHPPQPSTDAGVIDLDRFR